jgi:glycopeptide antibiotics resistance protein
VLVVVGIGFAASLAIETTQYLLDTGRTADIDDLIENTLGALIGWLIVAAVVARRKDAVD